VYLEKLLAKRWLIYLRPIVILIPIVIMMPIFKFVLPVLSPDKIAENTDSFERIGLLKWEDGKNHALPQDFADMLGWSELAGIVDIAFDCIEDKENTLIHCDNYGQAGAINFYSNQKFTQAVYQLTGNMFWIYAWIVVSAFSIFMAMFYSNLIVPLFNKQTPLEEGELRNAISDFSIKVGFKLDNIFVIDGSKRSTKANAYFTGLGAKKRIVLYDTLIDDLSTEELVAVLAHEIGHNKKKHVIQGLLIGLLQTGIVLFIFGLLVGNANLSKALGVEEANFHIGLIAFGVLYSPISFVTGIFGNMLSRKNEYQADRFAAENYKPEALAGALKMLSINNLSNLTPHKKYVFFHYSHPTLLQRLAFLKQFEK